MISSSRNGARLSRVAAIGAVPMAAGSVVEGEGESAVDEQLDTAGAGNASIGVDVDVVVVVVDVVADDGVDDGVVVVVDVVDVVDVVARSGVAVVVDESCGNTSDTLPNSGGSATNGFDGKSGNSYN
jgi:hypothetical protein